MRTFITIIGSRTPYGPAFLRGDSGFGTEAIMSEAEQRGLPYLFKLRLTANVKKLIKKTFSKSGWTDAGQGWQGRHETLRLEGWSRQRQVMIRSWLGGRKLRAPPRLMAPA